MSANTLFINEATLKGLTSMSKAIDFNQVRPYVKVAQDIYIQPSLGSVFYQRLQAGVAAGNLTVDEKNLIDFYITDSLVWYTMSFLPMTMGYQLFSKGFLQKTSEESNAPSRADLELIETKYRNMAEFYNTRMIQYLKENHSKFYTYLNAGSGVDIIFPRGNAYTCPIYLGRPSCGESNGSYINSSSSSAPLNVNYTGVGGETTFIINELIGRTVLVATRSGLSKVITTVATADTGYLQIVNGRITVPTGDTVLAGELFTFLYR